ncbi:MAG TPA: ABC transporter ATP-binding protein [Firmicutes bacterium]|uniref:ABC transporter ATP-binding protein n=1 Tax=Capillibacterium thermochitinicola TaxID=2699427 RepID=A0A8J6LIS7_9FIRM|nr:ABC transporter ATP-binding protein [Capillibacterium thermochitinicola]MBA2133400.1 ABC transporter ATP-binding protein [Capillibacterium thermochitinicola]HHW13061.1 ABC transporter ATP-binding protein [Bacillota bacterium]
MSPKMKKFFSYYRPYLRIFALDMACAFTASGLSLAFPLLVRYIAAELFQPDGPVATASFLLITLVLVAMTVAEYYCNFFITYYGHVMGARMEADLRNELFAHLQKLSFSYYDNQKTGQIMSRITNDLFEITELYHHGPEDLLISAVKLVGSFIILITINPPLTLIVFSFIPPMFLFAYHYNRKMRQAFQKNRARVAAINAGIEDSISGVRVVKSFANEHLELEKFHRNNHLYLESKKDSYYYMARYHSGINAFSSMIYVAVVIAAAILIQIGKVSTLDLVTFLLYINAFLDPIKKLVNFGEQFQNGFSGFDRFYEILQIAPDIVDSREAVELTEVKGEIAFENVSFRYPGTTTNVLSHVNLKVAAGEYVALVGPSGVGKTTLCSLIPRFYEVTEGRITLDGIDIREIKLKSLRRKIGIVQQDVYLFAGTVLENIRYGKPEATVEEVITAAKKANAHDFIMALPEGYETNIGQRGVKLSGGQKQRLSIARVFLKDPPILIFDEATSALDNESEKVIQESMEALAKDRTTFVIAHRLSTIRNARRILVLAEDGIVEEGTHEELIARNGLYAQLYRLQFA